MLEVRGGWTVLLLVWPNSELGDRTKQGGQQGKEMLVFVASVDSSIRGGGSTI